LKTIKQIKMRKRINQLLTCTVLAAMLLTGCNSEETLLVSNNENTAEKGKLSFVLPLGKKSPVTYAPVTGLDNEYELENLFIFWFTETAPSSGVYELFKTFTYGTGADNITLSSSTLTSSANMTTATVQVGDENAKSRFYIVANVNGTQVASNALTNLAAGADPADLEAAVANVLATDANGYLEHIATPLPMSIRDAAPTAGGYAEVNDPSAAGTVTSVILKRRVARFDIINTADYSNFEVTRVIVSRAQKTGWLHDKPFAGTETWLSEGNTVIDASTANGPAGAGTDNDGNGIDDAFDAGGAQVGDSLHVNEAVFYLWPTILEKNDLIDPKTSTEIVIEGKFYGGITRLYKLHLTADQPIEANKLYRIKIVRHLENQLKFELTVDDWDDEVEIPTVESGKTVAWSTATFSTTAPGGATVDLSQSTAQSYEYAASALQPVTVTIVTEGTNLTAGADKHVTTVKILAKGSPADYLASDLTDTQNPANITSSTKATYGAYYITTHTITLAPTDAPLETTLQISNAANEYDSKTVTLLSNNYGKTGYAPVRVGDLLWAPVNVGATKLATSGTFASDANGTAIAGNHYQWGRNVPFEIHTSYTTTAGPVTASVAAGLTTFITSGADWLTPSDDALWEGVLAQGPCPQGWRVPTKGEFNIMLGGTRSSIGTYFIKVVNTGGDLYFPMAGNRVTNTALIANIGSFGHYWTSTPDGANVCAYRTDKVDANANFGRAQGFSVRAVRDVP
jgi:hypothetical protein